MKNYRKFRIREWAILKKGGLGILVLVVGKFESKISSKRNPSKISYHIKGYGLRNWCFQEELRRINIFDRIFKILIRKINKR